MILLSIILAAISILFAAIHAHLINTGKYKKLRKWAWAILYTGVAALFSAINKHEFDWWLFLNAALIRVPFFNVPLNRLRNPPVAWFYVTPELSTVTGFKDAISKGRFWDYLLWKIFGNSVVIPYAACFIASIWVAAAK